MTDAQPPAASASDATTGTAPADVPGSGVPGSGVPGSGVPGSGVAGGRRPRARRRRTPWRAAFFVLAGFAIIAAVGWALLGNRVFIVRSVTVTGTHLVTQAEVIAAADVPLGTPLVRVDSGAVTRRVEAIRQVASATVTEGWPDHVAIAITERVPSVAVRMTGGGYDLLDHSGIIVRWSSERPAGLPLFATTLTGSALSGDPGVAAAAEVLAELDPALARSVAEVGAAQVLTGDGNSVVTAEQVTLSLRDGKTVVWGDPRNAATKNRELTILLRDSVRYVDVSAPGTVVTK